MIAIVIPAYNEESSIGNVIERVLELYDVVIVVDDGSKDHTYDITKNYPSVTIIRHPVNMGLGAATRTGLKRAYEIGAEIAVKIDADFQHEVWDIHKVIDPIMRDQADCVFGTRFKGGLKYKMPLYRNIGNKFFSWLVSLSTGLTITDGQTGLMAFHRRYLEVFDIISDYNETQQLIMDAYGKKMRIVEVPVMFNKRVTGQSFISWKYPIKVIPAILRMFMTYGAMKIFTILAVILLIWGRWEAALVCFAMGLFADLITTRR
jgi:glycosyltransferase involved in cell wall biosynthesis